MPTPAQQQRMQEALDRALAPHEEEALQDALAGDAESAAEYARLQTLDRTLRAATLERAPDRLAANILARIAQAMPRVLPGASSQALALALGLLTLVLTPLLVAASWLVMVALGGAAGLAAAVETLVGVVALALLTFPALVAAAENALATVPLGSVLVLLIPLAAYALWRTDRASQAAPPREDPD